MTTTARQADTPKTSGYPADAARAYPASPGTELATLLRVLHAPVKLVQEQGRMAAEPSVSDSHHNPAPDPGKARLTGYAPAVLPEAMGDAGFCSDLGIRYPYLGGSMAKGISSIAMVEELGKAGMLGFFGAAGLPFATVETAVDRLASAGFPCGFNLIHSPQEPDLEAALADLYVRKGVRLVEASAFLALTLPLVRYRVHGIHRSADGTICCPNRIIAKVSREELAEKFFSPPPEKFLRQLVAEGAITAEQAELAALIPLAQEVTAEADSGGHTDNRPAMALFPTIRSVASRMQSRHGRSGPWPPACSPGTATG